MAGKYIFSTLTASQKYPIWKATPATGMPVMDSHVLIAGGANLPSKVLITPRGVMTHVSDEEFERLQECQGYLDHVERGFLTIEDAPHDPAEVAEDMEPKDGSAPMVEDDFSPPGEDGPNAPKTGNPNEDEPDNSRVHSTGRPGANTDAADTKAEKKAKRAKKKADKEAAAAEKGASESDAPTTRTRRNRRTTTAGA